jgi:hypothetical protein
MEGIRGPGINGPIPLLVMNIQAKYEAVKARPLLHGSRLRGVTQMLLTGRWVRQGCTLSPLLCVLFLDPLG